MINRHRPDGTRLAFMLTTTYCEVHKAGHHLVRSHCHPCLADKIRRAIYEATHPDCSIPEVLRAIGTPGLMGPENMRELARVYSAAQALFALDGLQALLQLARRS